MVLFAAYNNPYLFALCFVLLIGLLEILSLVFGHYLSGALDAHLSQYDSLTSGNIGQALHYLNIGRIPALVILCLLAGFFWSFRHTFPAWLHHGLASPAQQPGAGPDLLYPRGPRRPLLRKNHRALAAPG